jgi:4-amino-4-deoxy-L-arabinose transferase-like glycosyltransferase
MNRGQRLIYNPEVYLVLGIGLLAFLTRIAFSFAVFPYIAGPLDLGTDPDQFGQIAQNWVDGKGYTYDEKVGATTYRGPGYPLLLAAVYMVFGNLFPAAVLVHCLLGSLVCVLMYYIGKQIFSSWVGSTAAVMGTLHPLLIWYSPRLRYEHLLTLLLVLAIFWLLKFQLSRSRRDAFLLGIFFGSAALVNQIVIILPLVLFAGFFFMKDYKPMLINPMFATLVIITAIIVPWTVRNYQISGIIIPVHSGGVVQFIKGNYEFEHYYEAPLRSVELDGMGNMYIARLLGHNVSGFDNRLTGFDQALFPHALSFLWNEPRRLLTKIAMQMPRFWYLSENPLKSWFLIAIQGPLLLLAIGGTFHILISRSNGFILVLTIIYFNLIYALLHVEGRFSTPVVPFVIILAAGGMKMIFSIFRKSHFQPMQDYVR